MTPSPAMSSAPPSPPPPRVSVIVPTLNRRADLLEFTDSLKAQTVLPHELLVVDAGAVPDMEEALRERLHGSGISLIYRRSAAGTSLQRNIALDLMSGDYVALCDDDLLLEPTFIERCLECFALPHSPPVGCVLGTFTSPPRPRGWQQRWFHTFGMTTSVPGDEAWMTRAGGVRWLIEPSRVVRVPVASGGRTVYRAACFDGVRFDEFLPGYTLAEDVELSWRIGQRWSIVQTPYARCFHKRADGGRVDYGDRVSRLLYSQYYFFKKHVKKDPRSLGAFAWTQIGTTVFYTGVGALRAPKGEKLRVVRGIARGYRRVARDLAGLKVT